MSIHAHKRAKAKEAKAHRRGRIEGFLLATESIKKTAEVLQCSRNTVAAIHRKLTRRADMDRYRKKNKKAKSKAAINERRRIVDRLLSQTVVHVDDHKKGSTRTLPKYATTKDVQDWFREHRSNNPIPSIATLRRDAKALNYVNYVRPKVPFRKVQKARRVKFCKKAEYSNPAFVKRMLFSDEHTVTTNDNSSRTQWVKRSARGGDARRNLHPRSVRSKYNTVNSMFWAMIGYNYKSEIIWLEFDDGSGTGKTTCSLTKDRYVQHILTKVEGKLKQRRVIFMQDGAPSHSAKTTKEWLRARKITFIEDWPANSPDLNPIEDVWAEVNRRLAKKGCARDKAQLKQMVEEVWREYPMEKINNHVMSFLTKAQKCAKNRGGLTK